MTDYVAIHPDVYQGAGYAARTDFGFCAAMPTAPLLREELPYTLQYMSIAFQKRLSGTEESFELVCLQSLTPANNLFLRPDGRWLVNYMPAFYKAAPFTLLPAEKSNQRQLGVKRDCVIMAPTDKDLRFYDGDGKLTARLQEVLRFLAESLRSRRATLALCKSLQDAKLIVPWPIRFTMPDDNKQLREHSLDGLYHIDSEALKALPADQVAGLNASGALGIAYAQRLSEPRLKDLAVLQTTRSHLQQQSSMAAAPEPDLDELFADKGDLFSF